VEGWSEPITFLLIEWWPCPYWYPWIFVHHFMAV